MPLGLYTLGQTRALYGSSGSVTPKDVGENFYQELSSEFDSRTGAVLISEHSFEERWPTWEVHPEGDELVYLLEGDTDFVFWIDGSEQIIRVSRPGTYVIVPRNTWHTARPYAPTRMIFFTHGEGTLNAVEPGGKPLTI